MDCRSTTLVCTAPHPRGIQGDSRYQGKVHGVRLQVVPFSAKPTYRKVEGWSDARPGHLIVRCSSCGAFSEYWVVQARPPAGQGGKDAAESGGRQGVPDRIEMCLGFSE